MKDERLLRQVENHPYPLVFATISGAHLYGFPSPDQGYNRALYPDGTGRCTQYRQRPVPCAGGTGSPRRQGGECEWNTY